ncbi:hypothetical protein [Streptomyces sp. NRRL F-5650]|uniref:hypothetical protein n=1 Tax=Streptomyces sp. NRRL F-5650 TaxID=1463868 RepID=UPI001F3A3762|nr:hypothetical protein [Streptomyces sp. NRRL F-5650]
MSRARRWTRDILRGSPLAEDAELIVSELSANAILHTASGREYGSFHLAVAVSAQVVAVSVTDVIVHESDHGHTVTAELYADASDEAWEWLYEGRVKTRRALLRTEPCTVSVPHAETRITWTIRPVLFLPLAHRQATELPACAHDFKPRQTD